MSLREFIGALRVYWKTFAVSTGALLTLGISWVLLSPLQYVSTAQLLVSLNGNTTASAYQNADVVSSRVSSYVALSTSDVVGQRVIDKLGLQMRPQQLAAKISAVQVPQTAILDIAVTDASPEQARAIAETFATEFVRYTTVIESPTGEDAQRVKTTIVSTASPPQSGIAEKTVLAGLVAILAVLGGATAVWLRVVASPVRRTA